MSDKENPEEGVEIPETEPGDFGSQKARASLSPAARFGLVIGGVFVLIGGAVYYSGQEIADPASAIDGSRADLDSTPGGRIQSESPRYQQLLEESNSQNSERAQREGRTFIPTPEEILRPIDDLEAGERIVEPEEPEAPEAAQDPAPQPEPDPEPRVVSAPAPPPAPAPRQAPRPPRAPGGGEGEENPFKDAIIGQMSSIETGVGRSGLAVQTVTTADADVATESRSTRAIEGTESAAGAEEEILIPAGEIIYAETRTSTNSDLAGSPVLVEVTSGEFRGARLIGGFTVNEASDKMVIEFTKMTMPDGTPHDVSAYAVDGFTAEAAVASDVERRYLQRYGPLLAAAFITSYAEGMSEPEQTLTAVGDETAIIQEPRTETQSLYAGLGAAADAIGSDLQANAPTGPKIILRDGWPLAVMFTDSMTDGQ